MTPFNLRGPGRAKARLARAGLTTAFALALLAFFASGSIVVAGAMFLVAGVCVASALFWVQRQEQKSAAVPEGALWSGPATVRVRDMVTSPLLDTVTVSRPAIARAQRRPARGAIGDVVVDPEGLTWTARWDSGLAGVRGSFTLPWSAVIKAQAAAIPAATPGSGAIALTFADQEKLDIAFSGNYPGFRAALTLLSRPLPGLGD